MTSALALIALGGKLTNSTVSWLVITKKASKPNLAALMAITDEKKEQLINNNISFKEQIIALFH